VGEEVVEGAHIYLLYNISSPCATNFIQGVFEAGRKIKTNPSWGKMKNSPPR
jgi:hypothetical protein